MIEVNLVEEHVRHLDTVRRVGFVIAGGAAPLLLLPLRLQQLLPLLLLPPGDVLGRHNPAVLPRAVVLASHTVSRADGSLTTSASLYLRS